MAIGGWTESVDGLQERIDQLDDIRIRQESQIEEEMRQMMVLDERKRKLEAMIAIRDQALKRGALEAAEMERAIMKRDAELSTARRELEWARTTVVDLRALLEVASIRAAELDRALIASGDKHSDLQARLVQLETGVAAAGAGPDAGMNEKSVIEDLMVSRANRTSMGSGMFQTRLRLRTAQ
jgi:chromosome segregation ATPase